MNLNKLLKKSLLLVSLTLLMTSALFMSNLSVSKVHAAGYTNTKWQYYNKMNYSTKAEKLAVGSIAIVVNTYLPWKSAIVGTGIAGLYYNEKRKNVYTTIKYYRKFANVKKNFKPLAGEKRVVYFYKDSARKNLISKQTQYKYTSWYVK